MLLNYFYITILLSLYVYANTDSRDEFINEITDGSYTNVDDDDDGGFSASSFMKAIIMGLIEAQYPNFDSNGDGGIDESELSVIRNMIPIDSALVSKMNIVNYDENRDFKLSIEEFKVMVENNMEEFVEAMQAYYEARVGENAVTDNGESNEEMKEIPEKTEL